MFPIASAAGVCVALGVGALCLAGVALAAGQRQGPGEAKATASLRGRVIVAGEAPAVPIRRARVRLDGGTADSGRFTDTDTDGRYRFDGLPAGAYRVTADKPGYVTLSAGASRPSTRPPPIGLLPGEAKAVDIALPRGAALEASIRIAADGTFAIPSLFGPVVFRLNGLPAGWALAGAWLDGRDVTDSVSEMRGAERPQRLQLRITRRTARLVATLAPDASPIPPDARVIVFSTDERLWTAPSRFVHVSGPDAEGDFSFDTLLPGAYHVAARAYLEDDSWHDLTLLHRLREGAAGVTLAAGDAASVAVNMGRVP